MVKSQIDNLTPGPSFGYNLCFKCPNGSCKPILEIYVLRAFQKYKKIFDTMNFGPYNRPLKIWKSTVTPTPKVGVHLGVWGLIPSHFPTLPRAWNVTFGFHFWPAPLPALALITSPRLKLRQFVWHTYGCIEISYMYVVYIWCVNIFITHKNYIYNILDFKIKRMWMIYSLPLKPICFFQIHINMFSIHYLLQPLFVILICYDPYLILLFNIPSPKSSNFFGVFIHSF